MVDWIGQILDMSVEQQPKDELEDFCQRQVDYGYNIKVSFLEFLHVESLSWNYGFYLGLKSFCTIFLGESIFKLLSNHLTIYVRPSLHAILHESVHNDLWHLNQYLDDLKVSFVPCIRARRGIN